MFVVKAISIVCRTSIEIHSLCFVNVVLFSNVNNKNISLFIWIFRNNCLLLYRNSKTNGLMKNEQIEVILANEQMTPSAFAEKIGVQRSAVSHLMNNRNKVSLDIVKKIHSAFPHINLYWLMDEKGDYYLGNSKQASTAGSSSQAKTVESDAVPSSTIKTAEESQQEEVGEEPGAPEGDGRLLFRAEPQGTDVVREGKHQEGFIREPLQRASGQHSSRRVVEIKVFYDDGSYENYRQG